MERRRPAAVGAAALFNAEVARETRAFRSHGIGASLLRHVDHPRHSEAVGDHAEA
jgi:hypothetical protein